MGLQCNRPGRRQRALSPTGGQHPQCRGDRVDPAGGEHQDDQPLYQRMGIPAAAAVITETARSATYAGH